MAGFKFGKRSLSKLEGVHPDLVAVAHEALRLSPIDFSIIEGVRSAERQAELFEIGATKTMNSRHLTGHAIDVAPYAAGKIRWDWPLFFPIAKAFCSASTMLNINMVWGGVWDRSLHKLILTDIEGEVDNYVNRRRKQGKKAFLDGPHFELMRGEYP